MDFLPSEDGGISKADPSLYRLLHRSGENLAIGEVLFSRALDELTFLDGEADIYIRTFQHGYVVTFQPADQLLLFGTLSFPEGDWVIFVEHPRAINEFGVIPKRHIGFLCHGII